MRAGQDDCQGRGRGHVVYWRVAINLMSTRTPLAGRVQRSQTRTLEERCHHWTLVIGNMYPPVPAGQLPWRLRAAFRLACLRIMRPHFPLDLSRLGFLIAFAGAIVVPVVFGVLATDHYVIVGWSYAAGVAAAVVVATVVADGIRGDWFGPVVQFVWIFAIVACVSLLGSLPCALVKWEDKKSERELSRAIVSRQSRPVHPPACATRPDVR